MSQELADNLVQCGRLQWKGSMRSVYTGFGGGIVSRSRYGDRTQGTGGMDSWEISAALVGVEIPNQYEDLGGTDGMELVTGAVVPCWEWWMAAATV